MTGRLRIWPVAGLAAAGALGGALALGGAALFAGFSRSTTTVRELQPVEAPPNPASFQNTKALSINQIYRRAASGVVQVTATQVVNTQSVDPFFGFPLPQNQREEALGSGFVIDKAGHIVTNYHVIEGARTVRVSFSNNESMKARVVGSDPSTDIAVLQVRAHSRALTPLPLGNSDAVRVGDSVVAIGNPFGLERTVTAGIVSALQRVIEAPDKYSIDHVIQTDAALNKGNSGGPLLDASGLVIGVNSQIQTGTGSNVGVGFAVPIDTVKTVAAQIIKTGHAEHAFLGIRVQAGEPERRQALPPARLARPARRERPAAQRRRVRRPPPRARGGDGLRRDLPAGRRPDRVRRRHPARFARRAPRHHRGQAARRHRRVPDLARRPATDLEREAWAAADVMKLTVHSGPTPWGPVPGGGRSPARLAGPEEGGPPPARASFLFFFTQSHRQSGTTSRSASPTA